MLVTVTTTCKLEDCERPRLARGYCKPHYRRFMQHGDPLVGGLLPEQIDRDGKRVCTDCGETKNLEEFGPSERSHGGRKRFCKRCSTVRSLAWQRANARKVQVARRAGLVRRTYGEDGVKAEQRRLNGEGCDVCGGRGPRMAIDHCHDTNRVRGLLCKDCNLVIGWLNDDPARLRALADYLERATAG